LYLQMQDQVAYSPTKLGNVSEKDFADRRDQRKSFDKLQTSVKS